MNEFELFNSRIAGLARVEVAIVGIVRNIETTLKADVNRIKSSLSDFSKTHWFLVESDSIDNSVKALEEVSKSEENFNFISLANLEERFRLRTERLAFARNLYLDELSNNSVLKSVKYIIVADFNGLNNLISRDAVRTCWLNLEWDVCTANQSGKYYDIWALRHPLWSPNDCWEQHAFNRRFMRNPEKALYTSVHSKMIKIPTDCEWIEVESAFGGFAIYKSDHLINARYQGIKVDGRMVCEHVPLHEEMRRKGSRIFLNTKMINTDYTDHSRNSGMRKVMLRLLMYPIKLTKLKLP